MGDNYDFRIIIIDDNEEIHKDFIKLLTKNSATDLNDIEERLFEEKNETEALILPRFKIDTATQGQDGIKLIKKALSENHAYALAFIDVRMPPGIDGIETIKQIWAIDPDIHVVLCTAHSDYTWEETIKELGHSDNFLILKKPFDYIAVRQLAYALTRKWKLIRESRVYTHSLENAVQARTKELKYQATHDILTGLANRVLLRDKIQQAINHSKRQEDKFAVLFIDLDRFKLVNDSLGHSTGDQLLKLITKRLLENTRSLDTLSRLGGDEFVLVVTELKDDRYLPTIGNKILDLVRQPLNLVSHELHITCSIGIAIYPQDGVNIENLLRNADAAMYHAKKMGGDQFQFYSGEMNNQVLEELKLESQLRSAMINHEFSLWYQPQFQLEDKKLEAVEALIRWHHPEKGLLLPNEFIPLAERCGIIIPLGEWILREACMQNKIWQKKGFPKIRVAVNITFQQLNQEDFINKVVSILKETDLQPHYLELEISESILLNNNLVEKINQLRDFGINIALDDFGIGYSNLHCLSDMNLNRLKIDQSFINNIQANRNNDILLQAIISMAKSLDFEVLAEGVETQKQLEFLKTQQCNKIQGFYFSKPLPVTQLTNLLKNPAEIEKLVKKE